MPQRGLFVTSHRPVYVYQRVAEIPTQLDARDQLFQLYMNDLRSRFAPRTTVQSASYQIKRALISLATFGYGNQAVERNNDAVRTFEGFQDVLRMILPPSLRFVRLQVRLPELVLITRTGDFAFDGVSGGISALIDLAWQVFLLAQASESFVVLIDEPENHLHPELQRTVLPSLIRAFPNAQFIVATHNPFIVTAVRESSVFVLSHTAPSNQDDQHTHVVSSPLDLVNKAGSSNEVLRDVLGLPNAMPLWVEQAIGDLASKYEVREFNRDTVTELKQELSGLGLGRYLPEALSALIGEQDDSSD